MAGGEGAKERRRLKRQQGQARNNDNDSAIEYDPESSFSKSNKNDKTKTTTTTKISLQQRGGSHKKNRTVFKTKYSTTKNNYNNNNNKDADNDKQTKKKKKTNKPKKPKHLKRKLEQLGDDDLEQRQELEQKMAAWESKKEKFSFHKHTNNNNYKRTKTQPPSSPPRCGTSTNEDERGSNMKKELKNALEKAEEEEHVVAQRVDAASTGRDSTRNNEPKKKELQLKENVDDSDSDSDDDDDDNEEENQPEPRQRGRRRRGRKDTAKQIQESQDAEKTLEATAIFKQETSADSDDENTKKKRRRRKDASESDNRYCVGRKPVTDFVIGQTYSGKVVYVKPFGIFLDIGCHSDAFCHVSRLSDDYVESPEALYKEGETVQSIRIVEIDRKQKKITVSLQSHARIQDEQASMQARQQRKDARKNKNPNNNKNNNSSSSSSKKVINTNKFTSSLTGDYERQRDRARSTILPKNEENAHHFRQKQPKPSSLLNKKTASSPQTTTTLQHLQTDESTMTPAELKRARKLARRAARREQQRQGAETNSHSEPAQ